MSLFLLHKTRGTHQRKSNPLPAGEHTQPGLSQLLHMKPRAYSPAVLLGRLLGQNFFVPLIQEWVLMAEIPRLCLLVLVLDSKCHLTMLNTAMLRVNNSLNSIYGFI